MVAVPGPSATTFAVVALSGATLAIAGFDEDQTNATFGIGALAASNACAVTTREVVDLILKSGVSNKQFEFFADESDFMEKAAKTPRSNCVLDSSKLLASAIVMSEVHDAIARALKNWKA